MRGFGSVTRWESSHEQRPGFPALDLLNLFYSLHLFTLHLFIRFTHRTVFCRWDNDVFILHTTRRPCRSTAPRHPASTRALSLSLLLGLSPLAGITPAALATPTQAAPDQQAQPAQATPASPAAALNQRQAENQQIPAAQGEQTSSLPTCVSPVAR